jgi:hypothetical protein
MAGKRLESIKCSSNKEQMTELRELVNRMSLCEDLSGSKILEVSQKLDNVIMDYYYNWEKSII